MIRRKSEIDRDRGALARARKRRRCAGIGPNLMAPWWGAPVDPCSCAGWTPANLDLTGFWDASFDGSAPWEGTASLGISGTKDLDVVDLSLPRTHTSPTAGSAVNGFTPAAFDGRMFLDSSPVEAMQLNTPDAFGVYADAQAFSCWVVAKVTERGAPNAHVGGAALVCYNYAAGSRPFFLYLTDGGLSGNAWPDGGSNTSVSCNNTPPEDAWVIATFRKNGTNMQVGLNEIPGTQVSSSVAYSTALSVGVDDQISVGMERFVFHSQEQAFAGDMLQIGMADRYIPDSEWCKIICAARTKFDLALTP